jgi:hypothetical protein
MGQIDDHRVSLGHRVARGQAPELISYGQTHETIKAFSVFWLPGLQDTRVSPPCIMYPRCAKSRKIQDRRSRNDLGRPSNGTRGGRSSHFGYRDFERIEGLLLPLHFKIPKLEMPKGSRPEAVPHLRSDLGRPSKGTRGARSSHFSYRDFERTEGLLLPLHFRIVETRNPESAFEDRHRVTARGHLG